MKSTNYEMSHCARFEVLTAVLLKINPLTLNDFKGVMQ
jgi:hypothetical protein